MSKRKIKRQALKEAGALNSHAERVRDPLFETHPFFDPEDKAQVKYEMLRARELDEEQLQETCKRFGFTRESYRQILERFRSWGMFGLFDRKRGRKGPLKIDAKVRQFLQGEREKHPDCDVDDLMRRCEEETGVSLSRRSVYRVLSESDSGEPKKKRLRKTSRRN